MRRKSFLLTADEASDTWTVKKYRTHPRRISKYSTSVFLITGLGTEGFWNYNLHCNNQIHVEFNNMKAHFILEKTGTLQCFLCSHVLCIAYGLMIWFILAMNRYVIILCKTTCYIWRCILQMCISEKLTTNMSIQVLLIYHFTHRIYIYQNTTNFSWFSPFSVKCQTALRYRILKLHMCVH